MPTAPVTDEYGAVDSGRTSSTPNAHETTRGSGAPVLKPLVCSDLTAHLMIRQLLLRLARRIDLVHGSNRATTSSRRSIGNRRRTSCPPAATARSFRPDCTRSSVRPVATTGRRSRVRRSRPRRSCRGVRRPFQRPGPCTKRLSRRRRCRRALSRQAPFQLPDPASGVQVYGSAVFRDGRMVPSRE